MRKLKIAFIHQERKLQTGAHYINELMSAKLRQRGVSVKHFYPRTPLVDSPHHFKGINNILFFHSLLERREEILKCDLIQGTTYTPLAFLPFDIPVVSHFGSTTWGFLGAVPQTHRFAEPVQRVWRELRRAEVIRELNLRTRRPLRDIASIEKYVAIHSDAVLATSAGVASELRSEGVVEERLHLLHNAIEDFWFEGRLARVSPPRLVCAGRFGADVFTLKLKGFDRLVSLWRRFPEVEKLTIAMTTNRNLVEWMRSAFPSHAFEANLLKTEMFARYASLRGSVFFHPSRYEGFGLSLVEAMSQGLIPITFAVGVAPEAVENGRNGFIVGSLDEAERRAREILADEAMRAELSMEASKTAARFRADAQADRLIAIYSKLAGRRRQAS